jgi:hypothetical protein
MFVCTRHDFLLSLCHSKYLENFSPKSNDGAYIHNQDVLFLESIFQPDSIRAR